jgi:hypothetical protein
VTVLPVNKATIAAVPRANQRNVASPFTQVGIYTIFRHSACEVAKPDKFLIVLSGVYQAPQYAKRCLIIPMATSAGNLDFTAIWYSLSGFNKIFFILFCCVSVYTVYLSFHALSVLHSLKRREPGESLGRMQHPVAVLRKRLRTLRQLHAFTLLFFFFCILVQIPATFHIFRIGDFDKYPFPGVVSTLTVLFTCDAVVSFGFLLLHCLQWMASGRVESFALKFSQSLD